MPPEPAVPIPAATVVVLRDAAHGPEVLLTHRPATMAFAAGMHVFPGGRVDADDASPGLAARSVVDAAEAAHVAAVRELWEESGILLADTSAPVGDREAARAALVAGSATFGDLADALDLRFRTDLLAPLSRWVTPPGYPRRFDAHFFAAVLPADAGPPSIASDEVVALEWFRPGDALDAMADGRIGLWLPTSSTLQQLEHVSDVADLAALAPGTLGPIVVDEPAPDVLRIVMPAGGGVAGQPVCAYLVGSQRFVLVDPGDPTGPALERCLEEAAGRGGVISAIALTHVDPDHHGGAEGLAERLEIPVFAGPGASRRLPYQVRELADSETIGDGDVTIGALATPGPRPDHLAYVIDDRAAVLTGDLDGGRGARMLPGPADDAAWAASRARLDALGSMPPTRRTPRAMSEPTGSRETPDLPEARGPHLPDAIARVPGPVWPFLVLTALAAFGRWQELSSVSFSSPIDVIALIAGSVPPIVAPLLGVALFARHPSAHRTMPSVAFGVVLFAALTVVDRLREPILESIASLDPTFASTGPAFLGYGLVQALISVFALTYLSIGLARRAPVRGQPRAAHGPDPAGRRGDRGAGAQRLARVRLAQRPAAVERRVHGVRARDQPGVGIPRLERLPRLVRGRRAGHRLGARGRRRRRLRAHRSSGDGAERFRLGEWRE